MSELFRSQPINPAYYVDPLANPASRSLEVFARKSVWDAMSLEQKTKASELRTTIAEQLSVYGVTAESLRVVMNESKAGERNFTLIHAGNGIDICNQKVSDISRCYNSVMAKENNSLFFVRAGDKVYDVRNGMTDSVYYALVDDVRERSETLPDSEHLSQKTGDMWTWTMLTGEPLTYTGRVRIRRVYGAGVRGGVCYPDDEDPALRVRPAVVIE